MMVVVKALFAVLVFTLSFLGLMLNALIESVLDGISLFSESCSNKVRNALGCFLERLNSISWYYSLKWYYITVKDKVRGL